MNPLVHPARPNDLPGILALYRELRPRDPELSAEIAQQAFNALIAREDLYLFVCEVARSLVATCMLAVIPNLANGMRPFGVIEHVVTLSSHRRRGYARIVLEHALDIAWSRSCYKVMLLSGAQRGDAHKLYESVGFVGDLERGFVIKP
ncbi:MAG TPA: GNAT family N-acetyltransferase [Burkholderiales bacterium]|nr:GNAT family N-acetyltransferase [Burkholderiales bacterium]